MNTTSFKPGEITALLAKYVELREKYPWRGTWQIWAIMKGGLPETLADQLGAELGSRTTAASNAAFNTVLAELAANEKPELVSQLARVASQEITEMPSREVIEAMIGKREKRATVSKNISEMVKAGHPQKQAVAASLNKARESGARIPKKGK